MNIITSTSRLHLPKVTLADLISSTHGICRNLKLKMIKPMIKLLHLIWMQRKYITMITMLHFKGSSLSFITTFLTQFQMCFQSGFMLFMFISSSFNTNNLLLLLFSNHQVSVIKEVHKSMTTPNSVSLALPILRIGSDFLLEANNTQFEPLNMKQFQQNLTFLKNKSKL